MLISRVASVQVFSSLLKNTGSESNLLYAFLLLIAAVSSFLIAVVAWKRRQFGPNASSIAFLMMATGWWGLTYAIHWSGFLRPSGIFWLNATYIGVVTVPAAYFALALCFTGKGSMLTGKTVALLAVEPVVTLILLWTDRLHGLFFAGGQLPRGSAILTGGPLFWINVIYSYLLMLVSYVILIRFAHKTRGLYGKQIMLILLGSLIPWISSLVCIAGVSPIPDLDLTPFAFTLTGIAFAYTLFRLNLLNIVPVARDALIEAMTDGVFVADLKNRVVDINPAAQEFLGLSKSSIGRNAEELFRNTPDLVALYRDVKEGQFELFTEYYGQRHLDMRVVPIFDKRDEFSGRLFIFRDITARKNADFELKKTHNLLQQQLSEIKALQSELRRQAIRDPLTGLYNRRYLEEVLERELSRASRENTSLCILMLDIDHFKVLNDTYGHRAGDTVLRALGRLLREGTRDGGDIACRYGGEEFVIMLTGTTLQDARCRAEHFCKSFEEMLILFDGNELSSTVSIGVAVYPVQGKTGEEILHAADMAMYLAKEAGRNRIAVWQENYPAD